MKELGTTKRADSTLFDYSALPAESRAVVQQKTTEIKRIASDGVIEIGRRLNQVKAELPHGQFGPWWKAEFPQWKETSIQQFMNAAKFVASNPQLVGGLESATATALIEVGRPSTPAVVREEVIEKLKAGERVTAEDVRQKVKATRKVEPPSATPNPVEVEQIPDEPDPPKPGPVKASPPAPEPPPKPSAEPWADYNAKIDVVIAAFKAVRSEVDALLALGGMAGAFSTWIEPKQWHKYVSDAVALFDSHHVERFATKAEMAQMKLPDKQNFLYSINVKGKGKRGAA